MGQDDRLVEEFTHWITPQTLDKFATNLEEYILLRPLGPWMIPESVPFPPTGRETGEFNVVDVGGSTCRLARVDVGTQETRQIASVPLDSVAKRNVVEFVVQRMLDYGLKGNVALTWSFPLIGGKFEAMGKGFANIHQHLDVITVFNDCLDSNGVPCRVESVCTDGASALIAQRFVDPECNVALTWGTGINLTVALNGQVINTEISMIGREDNGDSFYRLPPATTCYDEVSSLQPFESLVGGMHLARVAAAVLGEPVDFWPALGDPNHRHHAVVDAVCDRAAAAVAAVLTAFLRRTGFCVVSYTGGVIAEAAMRRKVVNYVQHLFQPIEFVPQIEGSLRGSAIVAAMTPERALF